MNCSRKGLTCTLWPLNQDMTNCWLAGEFSSAEKPPAMGEALAAGSAEVEAASLHLGLDMRDHWQADDAFIDLLRDREVLTCMIAEVAGTGVAEANRAEKVKAQKAVLRDCLAGANGRAKVNQTTDGFVKLLARPRALNS